MLPSLVKIAAVRVKLVLRRELVGMYECYGERQDGASASQQDGKSLQGKTTQYTCK